MKSKPKVTRESQVVRDLVVAIGRLGQATESYVTREELVAALDRVLGGLREEIRWGAINTKYCHCFLHWP